MPEIISNPIGTQRFEFVEFTGPDAGYIHKLFCTMGFQAVATHRDHDIKLYRQGNSTFILNNKQAGQSDVFLNEHNSLAGANAIGFKVQDAKHAFEQVRERGAPIAEDHGGSMIKTVPAIKGIGGSLIYLIDNPETMYEGSFIFDPAADKNPQGLGVGYTDHLTNNVRDMTQWVGFYSQFFNFRKEQLFDIDGKNGTGLLSSAMVAPCMELRIPLNEGKNILGVGGLRGQIEGYIEDFGEGIQHIALHTDDIYTTVQSLRDSGLAFLPAPPHEYYEKAHDRVVDHGEDMARLEELGILIAGSNEVKGDGTQDGVLLQIFTESVLGDNTFFEFIQRKNGYTGFGHENFAALFGTLEEKQYADLLTERGIELG